jgi:hypothetical protein
MQVGKPVSDDPIMPNDFLPPSKITVRRLDAVLHPSIDVALFKLDVEGFECKALDGMGVLLQRVNILRTEVAPHLLTPHGCATAGLMDRLRKAFSRVLDVNGKAFANGALPFQNDAPGFAEVLGFN